MPAPTFPFLRLAAALLLLLSAVPGRAQVREVTLQEAVDLALERNTTLRTAENGLDLARARRTQAYSALLPNLTASSDLFRSTGRRFINELDRLVSETTDFVNGDVQAGVTLFDGFGTIAGLRQARFAADAEFEALQRTRQTVVFTVAEQFLQVLLDKALLRIAEENVTVAENQIEQIREQVELGLRSNADLFQQQAELARRRVAVIDARAAVEVDASLLVQTLQIDPLAEVDFVGADVDAIPAEPLPGLRVLVDNAYESRPDLRQRRYDIRAAREGTRVARSGFWPSVTGFYQYGSRYNNADPTPFGDQFYRDNVQSYFGFSVTIPLFDRLAARTEATRARVERRNAELQLQNLEQSIVVEVRRAYLVYRTALERVEATEAQLRAADLALDAAQERYTLGATTFVELSQANAAQVEAAAGHAQARYTLRFQRLVLDYYVGTLDGRDLRP